MSRSISAANFLPVISNALSIGHSFISSVLHLIFDLPSAIDKRKRVEKFEASVPVPRLESVRGSAHG